MHYVSTRGGASPVVFSQALLAGIAEDGGLYLPAAWPTNAFAVPAGESMDFGAIAARILRLFAAGDATSLPRIDAWTTTAWHNFSHAQIAPLRPLTGNRWLLELFHGPTLSFKDHALQFLGTVLDDLLAIHERHLSVLVATSGDTGSAAMAALGGRQRAEVFVLFPAQGVSAIQRRQMTCYADPHAHAIAVQGSFDTCQALVKHALTDPDLRSRRAMGAVNSINWGRLLAQVVYYFYACARLQPRSPVRFIIPTGNFGNAYACWIARKLGAPIGDIVIAVGENDLLYRVWHDGIYQPRPVIQTCAPSIDIQNASNFERFVFESSGRDPERVRFWCEKLRSQDPVPLDSEVWSAFRRDFHVVRVSEACLRHSIRNTWRVDGEIVDPHTAVALAASGETAFADGQPTVILATAHPAKFPDTITAEIRQGAPVPPPLAALNTRPERCLTLTPHPNDLVELLEKHSRFPCRDGAANRGRAS